MTRRDNSKNRHVIGLFLIIPFLSPYRTRAIGRSHFDTIYMYISIRVYLRSLDIILLRLLITLKGIIINITINIFFYKIIIKINLKIFLREIIKNKEKVNFFYIVIILIDKKLNILIFSNKLVINLNYKLLLKL